MAGGVAADYGMLVAAVITTALIIWRDGATRPRWQTVAARLLFALLIAWSGHDTVQVGAAVVLVAMTLTQAVTGGPRPPHAGPITNAADSRIQSPAADGHPSAALRARIGRICAGFALPDPRSAAVPNGQFGVGHGWPSTTGMARRSAAVRACAAGMLTTRRDRCRVWWAA